MPSSLPSSPSALQTAALSIVLSFCGCATVLSAAPHEGAPLTVHPRDPRCVGDCLTGKDPFESGCAADARTARRAHVVTEDNAVIGVVELRVSPACGTAWTRILRTNEPHTGSILGGISSDDGATWLTFRSADAVSLWTDMQHVPDHGCAIASGVLLDVAGRAVADEARASDCSPRGSLVSR